MASRYRFYQWSVSPKQFALLRKRLEESEFNDEVSHGVRLTKAGRSFIEGRYFQKFSYEEQELLPGGATSTVERVGFVITNFILRPTRCGLVIASPPRSVSSFMMFVSTLLDHNVTVQSPLLDLIRVKRLVQSILGTCTVTSVKIAGAQLAENVVADIAITDQQDALERALKLYPQHRRCIGKIDIVHTDAHSGKSRLSVVRNGSISTTLPRTAIDMLWNVMEEALQEK